jgi:predicted site-specific integrase-resolvase
MLKILVIANRYEFLCKEFRRNVMSDADRVNNNLKQLLSDAVKLLDSAQNRLYGYEKNKYNDLKRYIDLSNIMKFGETTDDDISDAKL